MLTVCSAAEVEQQQLDQGFADMSDKDPQMGALLSNLHGSISSRHMDNGKVKVTAALMSSQTGIMCMVLKSPGYYKEGAEATPCFPQDAQWDYWPRRKDHLRLRRWFPSNLRTIRVVDTTLAPCDCQGTGPCSSSKRTCIA